MRTLLTTSRMAPALAERIEASLRRGRSRGAIYSPRWVSLFRFGAAVVILVALASLAWLRHRTSAQLERARSDLLGRAREQRAALTATQQSSVSRALAALSLASGAYEGDLVAEALANGPALDGALSRGVVYVRGPLSTFTSDGGIASAMATSRRDAFLLCLLDPPSSRVEGELLEKVRAAYAGFHEGPHAGSAHRLYDADVALRFLSPEWEKQVETAEFERDVAELSGQFARAPIDEGKKAAAANLLVFVMDEPNEPGGVTELDGEHAHSVRVGIVELGSGKVLLRQKKRADPSWISLSKRPRYATGLDACALSLDVRASVASAAAGH